MPGAFDGRLALVTGAGRGIGAAIAEALAAEGAHVVLTARTSAELEAVEEKIHAAGGSATIAPMDLTEPDAIARLAQAVAERWPALDILILNAAMLGTLTPVAQIDGKELNRLLTLRAAWRLDQGRMSDADAAMAKLYASEMLGRVTDQAVQIFGGMGLMSDLPVERFWRDARVERIWDGTSEIQRHIISRSMLRERGA